MMWDTIIGGLIVVAIAGATPFIFKLHKELKDNKKRTLDHYMFIHDQLRSHHRRIQEVEEEIRGYLSIRYGDGTYGDLVKKLREQDNVRERH